ncbi:MAG: sulfotransferase [Caulobacteraceae bacterium]|nr:sulfotransferase [Caulobacteraceae bacterium]
MQDKEIFFISGLPRSGSTLLCNILAQNPEFFVTKATSGCIEILFSIRNQWDRITEHQAEGVNREQLKNVLKGALNSYYLTDKNIVFDKGRGWLSMIETLEFILNKKAKLICTVRNINEILASFEGLWRNTTGQSQWNIEQNNYNKSLTIKGRAELWSEAGQPLGDSFNRLKDAVNRGLKDRIYFMEFDNLTHHPKQTMQDIYDFLNLKYYEHDFNNIQQYTKEDDDNVHRIKDLHTIRSVVKPVPLKAHQILGSEVANQYNNLEFWRNLK